MMCVTSRAMKRGWFFKYFMGGEREGYRQLRVLYQQSAVVYQ